VDYIIRTKNHALAKRFGWMLESLGCNYAKRLEKQTYKTMIPLDIARPIDGLKDNKWGVIVNIGRI
jgi:predicted transcriptional regulator of viral defense system